MNYIDINCDMGEGFGAYSFGNDGELLPYVSSVNIACGFHASDPVIMGRAVAAAKAAGAGIGAHPGLPDLQGFGRRAMAISPAEARAFTLYQLGALDAFCRSGGAAPGAFCRASGAAPGAHCRKESALRHVKPHGALYNMAAADKTLAEAICDAIASFDETLILLGLAGSELLAAAAKKGLRAASEVFADRAYEEDGSLRARGLPGAMIEDAGEAAARALRMASEGLVRAASGKDIAVRADSICVHGDGPRAPEFARAIRAALQAAGIQVIPLADTINYRAG